MMDIMCPVENCKAIINNNLIAEQKSLQNLLARAHSSLKGGTPKKGVESVDLLPYT